jgi:hypothetical protein
VGEDFFFMKSISKIINFNLWWTAGGNLRNKTDGLVYCKVSNKLHTHARILETISRITDKANDENRTIQGV